MYKNKELTLKTPWTSLKDFLFGVLGFGVILASTHGALIPEHHRDLSPTDFSAKVLNELHTHSDFHFQSDHILADPKQLRNVRSEDDKTAERDGLSNWDVYRI